MKNVVITGAAGQIGKEFIRHIAQKENYKVYALDLDFSHSHKLDFIKYITLDITKEQENYK